MPAAIDIDGLADVLREAAIAEIMPRFRNLGDGVIIAACSPDLWSEARELLRPA